MLQQLQRSGLPAYRQLAEQLGAEILAGVWNPGDRLPGELELAGEYGLSRTTVRLAMKELEKNALIYRRRGEGTFVGAHNGRTRPACAAFSEFVQAHASRLSREVLEMAWEEISDSLAASLSLPVSSQVLHFVRLDRLDGTPMAYDEGWIAAEQANLLNREDLLDFDFFSRWRQRQKLRLRKSVFELYADAAGEESARMLAIQAGSPVLVECSDVYTPEEGAGRIVTHYRHDLYHFKRVFHYHDLA